MLKILIFFFIENGVIKNIYQFEKTNGSVHVLYIFIRKKINYVKLCVS